DRPEADDHAGEQDHRQVRRVLLYPSVAERLDLVGRRRETHDALAMQRPVVVEEAEGQREFVLGLEHRYALLTPSWASSSVSIATALVSALKSGPFHRVGQAAKKFH